MTEKDINDLRDQLIKAERAYWLDNDPVITDQIYDDLRRRYRELTEGEERPIGIEGEGRATLPSPMYSLDNVFNKEEFNKWVRSVRERCNAEDFNFIVEYKHDGLSLSLHYKDGKLLEAYNRGNGILGEIVTDLIPESLKSTTLKSKAEFEIRGEIFVTKSNFDKINLTRPNNPYKNPRQCAVGVLRGSDTSNKELLDFRVFGYGKGSDLFLDESSALSNRTIDNFKKTEIFYSGNSSSDAFATCERICSSAREIDFPIDGAVVKVDSTVLRYILGYTAHHPRWAIAVKLKDESYETKLTGVDWTVGVQGTITPTLLIEPVDIDGVTIERATGDNATAFDKAKYAIGDIVYVKRSGDVIPKITGHKNKEGKREVLSHPKVCPSCGSKTIIDGAYLKCGNGFLCDGQIVSRLLHFVSKDALDLKGFGQAAIEWIVKDLKIHSGVELLLYFRDHNNRDKIFEHFGELVGVKLIGVCRKETYPLNRVLYALAIPSVGQVSARRLCWYIDDLEGFCNLFSGATEPVLPQIGSVCISNIRYWIDHPNFFSEVQRLFNTIKTVNAEPKPTEEEGVVCFTGSGSGYDRGMLESSAKRIGYRTSKTVTKKVKYLVTGETKPSASKIKKAMELSVPVISVADWIKKTT